MRSGKSYQKDSTKGPKTVYTDPPLDSDISPGTSLVKDRNLFKTLDLAWSDIQQEQQKDPTLQTVRERLRDPDPPTDENEFGMGEVNLWSQRKSLTEINRVLHRTFETAEGLTLYQQILVPGLLRKKFYSGSTETRPRVTLASKRPLTSYNVMHIGMDGGRT